MVRKQFREFEHTADRGIEIEAPTRRELFRRACLALAQIMVDIDDVRPESRRVAAVRADSDSDLIHDLLTELLNIFVADGFIWSEAEIDEGSDTITATLRGEPFDAKRHNFRGEVKAVTYHRLNVEHRDNGWHATIVLDV